MSALHTVVNETIIEALRVALESYIAEGQQLTVPNDGTRMPAEQESIIRKALFAGLQNLRAAVQQHATRLTPPGNIEEVDSHTHMHLASELTTTTPWGLSTALAQLASNATATQEFVQQAVLSIWAHLRSAASRREGSIAANAVYTATPDVTRVLEAAAAAQHIVAADGVAPASTVWPMTPGSIVAYLSTFSAAEWVWLLATLVLGYLILSFVFGRILGFNGLLNRRRPRTTTVLIGLPYSGKTALFVQLVHHRQLLETRASMRPNSGYMCAAAQHGRSTGTAGVKVVDCPGHPRLHKEMLRAVSEALNVVVVIDSVTVQDNQREGADALAELLINVLQSPEFYGVRRLLFACTKRDEVISYAPKAVRRLLEAAMVASIESRQNAMGRVESVRDSNNTVVTSKGRPDGGRRKGGGGRRHMLFLDGADTDDRISEAVPGYEHLRGAAGGSEKSFNFEQLGIPVAFVDVSSRPNAAEHKYSITVLEDFLLGGGFGRDG
ncbi:Signal recognition particle receptor beta subunit/Elongation factor Tu GTP binding domain containing protein, putative [Leishmania guyanensis]